MFPGAVEGVFDLGCEVLAVSVGLFAYGGWQTAAFIGGEVRNPRRNLPLGLIFGGWFLYKGLHGFGIV